MDRIAEPDSLQLEFSRLYPEVILASSSPNRKALLEAGGTKVTVYKPDADESRQGTTPSEIVLSIARRKLEAYLGSKSFSPSIPAIAADTLVHIGGDLLGKPHSLEEARQMLQELSGKPQTVLTACGLKLPGKEPAVFLDEGRVLFRHLSAAEIEDYLATEEWKGAAGAYRLQKTGWKLVDKIEGDWTTVVGLPLKKLISLIS